MIGIPFIISEAAFTAVWLAVRAAVWIKQKHIDPKRELILSFMYISLAAIIRFTFFPMALADGKVQPLVFDSSTAFPFRINLFPFVNLLHLIQLIVLLPQLNIAGKKQTEIENIKAQKRRRAGALQVFQRRDFLFMSSIYGKV